VLFFDLKCSKDMTLLKMPYFSSLGTGLEFSPTHTNIPESLLLKVGTNYNVGYTLNRTVVGIKQDELVFQFLGFSLCRYVSFQIHGQKSTLNVSHIAKLTTQNEDFPGLGGVKVVKASKPVIVAVKAVVPRISETSQYLPGVQPQLYSLDLLVIDT